MLLKPANSIDAYSLEGEDKGLVGAVAFIALLFLIIASPLMRGGNRHVALIALEGAGLVFLVALIPAAVTIHTRLTWRSVLIAFVLFSPLWLAFLYLFPIPASLWVLAPGRDLYPAALASVGVDLNARLPLSLVPDATAASLLSGIPLVAAFIAGFALRVPQVERILAAFLVVAFVEVAMGLLQAGGGASSTLYFGVPGGRPFATFANPNHFANYLGMALVVYIWFASSKTQSRRRQSHRGMEARTRLVALWGFGALLLVLGILLSRSRGAALAGLTAALCAFALAFASGSRLRYLRLLLVASFVVLVGAVAMMGSDLLATRFSLQVIGTSAEIRSLLAKSTMEGAALFWPLGAGWGTFGTVYPRFQPPAIVGSAGYAHHDYAQLLFEGGIFSVLLMAAIAVLLAVRAIELLRNARRRGRLRSEEMMSAVCGVGLVGFLLHSFIEFNMHIPANAIMACLLAGIYLRPLGHDTTREPVAKHD